MHGGGIEGVSVAEKAIPWVFDHAPWDQSHVQGAPISKEEVENHRPGRRLVVNATTTDTITVVEHWTRSWMPWLGMLRRLKPLLRPVNETIFVLLV